MSAIPLLFSSIKYVTVTVLIIDTEVFDKKVMTYETREATYTFSHWVLNNKVITDEEIKAGILK